MDTITEQLISIESQARAAMNTIEKENAHFAHKAEENLARRIAQLESEGTETIKRLISEAEKNTAARIACIEEEYRIKTEMLDPGNSDFEAKRDRIFHDVLYAEL